MFTLKIVKESVSMYGRYIHELSGKTKIMMYGSHGEVTIK
jgi:hypothetical protein